MGRKLKGTDGISLKSGDFTSDASHQSHNLDLNTAIMSLTII